MTELVEVLTAQRDSAIESLKKLVRQLDRIKGYSSHQEQADLREARAVIVESERR